MDGSADGALSGRKNVLEDIDEESRDCLSLGRRRSLVRVV
jgi:hypothetical protein